ncbi:MAG: hypothetical protein Q7T74_02130 [Candidatus Saccharibacteria bacterium]|nr:hypothetical protein [Candidatus Saccharibacteria bacterium]
MSNLTHKRKELTGKIKHVVGGKKPDNWFTRTFSRIAKRFGLPFGIFLAILAALALTGVSMTLYFVSGTAKLDLSRPGYESARKQVHNNDGKTQNFSSNGEINSAVIKDFLNKYDREAKNSQQYGNYSENILDDAGLGIVNDPTAPTDGASSP